MTGSLARSSVVDQGIVIDAQGSPVDCTGVVWKLNCAGKNLRLNWLHLGTLSDHTIGACSLFIRHLIERQNPNSVSNAFNALRALPKSGSLAHADRELQDYPIAIFHELRFALGRNDWQLHYIRQWFGWCTLQGFEGFSPDVAFQAEQLRVGGNPKGHSVLSADPEAGPLTDAELAALLVALTASRKTGSLTAREQAALWLCVALGPNPLQMAMLTESDLVRVGAAGGEAYAHLRVPRMKKRTTEVRAEFRTRALTREIAGALEAAIGADADRALTDGPLGARSRPLFKRGAPRADLEGGPLDRYAWHLSSQEFTDLVRGAIVRLGVRSPRTGAPLQASVRRLRYTFATRLVREGVTKREVADLLDHTDTQNVQVYFDVKSAIVEKLDKAMAMALAPLAQAFMGHIVTGPHRAERGDDPASAVALVGASPRSVAPLGNCGAYGFCGLLAPIACYTCASFQPWMDAPHHLVLEGLLEDRGRRASAGLDGRMVSMMDPTITAVAEVIHRIDGIARERQG